MGFFQALGNVCIESAKNGFTNGILSTVSYDSELNDSPYNILENINSLIYLNDSIDFSGVSIAKNSSGKSTSYSQDEINKKHPGLNNLNLKNKVLLNNNDKVFDDDSENILKLKLPTWGYKNYVNERFLFKKNVTSMFGEPGYFHFRIFFDFNTQNGLLGGLLNDNSYVNSNNSAANYLKYCLGRYNQEKLDERINSLHKFASILSFITANAPWFFIGVEGLDKVGNPEIDNVSKEKSFLIDCNDEAIDMRLNTLLDLYKFSCYDEVNSKEIIPENLRKFNMKIMVFQTPIRGLHVYSQYNTNNKITYKNNDKEDDLMTFKVFDFYNCEIDKESLGVLIPNSLKNDKPFKIENSKIKIFYDKVYQYNSNEYFQMTFGSTGFYYNNYSMLQDFNTNNLFSTYNTRLSNYNDNGLTYIDDIGILQALGVDYIMRLVKSSKQATTNKGNIYEPYDVGVGSSYFLNKIKKIKNGENLSNIYYNNKRLRQLINKKLNK